MNAARLLIIYCGALSAFSTFAQPLVYSGSLSGAQVVLIAANGITTFNLPAATTGEQVVVDPTVLTLSYQDFQIQTQAFTTSATKSVTVGFGVTNTYTINLSFNSATFNFSDGGAAHLLTATTAGSYDLILGNVGPPVFKGNVNLTGSYTVVGPTQTASGIFDVRLTGFGSMLVPNVLDTSNYPTSLSLSSKAGYHLYTQVFFTQDQSAVNFVNEMVDGAQVTWAWAALYLAANPGSMVPGALPGFTILSATHTADTNQDSRLGLSELLRVIELYNCRNGSVRTGAYAVAPTNTEDSFKTDTARLSGAGVSLIKYHSADSNHDGNLSLSELLRVIELYNYRSGTVRTGPRVSD